MKEFYVAADGSAKGGDGSFENPFSGFQQARDAARTQKDQCTIYVRAGKYFFDEPLELDERDSGSSYCAYPGEEVILTGACMIQGLTWDEDEAGERMKHAFIGKGMNIDQLYVNHKALVMARYPDYKENVLPLGGVVMEAEIKERSKR